jgi:hypothetical protein
MEPGPTDPHHARRMTLATVPGPAKVLATCIILTMGVGMLGALGQIVVHDIIPTFFSEAASSDAATLSGSHGETMAQAAMPAPANDRGDLFADLATVEPESPEPFYRNAQVVWTLKWTHIHLFGMGMIFIFVGSITIWLDVGSALRSWLVVLPFIGMLADILAMWLKAFVSPAFFWLHVPGGGLFAAVFAFVSLRSLWEMWFQTTPATRRRRSP